MTSHPKTRSQKRVIQTAPQYEMDDGPLNALQLRQIKKLAPQDNTNSLRSSPLDRKRTGR